jgi:hypothetical protein
MKRLSIFALVVNLFLAFVLASGIGTITELPVLPTTGVIYLLTLIPIGANGVVAYASSLDISALPAKLEDYAMKDRDQILTKTLVDGMGFTEYFELLTGVTDEVPLTELVVGNILQPGNKDTFDPQNNKVQFKARVGKVRPMKVDLQFKNTQINAIYKSYLGKVAGGHIDPYKVPFEKFIFDRIIAQTKHDIRMKALFSGVYNAAGTAPVDTVNGIFKIVADEITGGGIPGGNVSAGAAITDANALDQIRLIVDLVYNNPDYMDVPMVALVSPRVMKAYNRDYQATYGSLPYNTEFQKRVLDDAPNITLIPEPGMGTSNRVIITPQQNLFWLVDDEGAIDNITIEKEKRNINIMMDFNCAPEVGITDIIWTNDYVGIS